jgi:propanediol dehydratase small subunit
MEPQNGVLLLVIGLAVIAMIIVSILNPRTIQAYWRRSCMGRVWKRTFPRASKDDIRQFLNMFVDAFALPQRRALQFAPTDRVLAIYRGLYPLKGWPDALELETFALQLERRYDFDLRKIWREELTLGEIFSRIDCAPAQPHVAQPHR